MHPAAAVLEAGGATRTALRQSPLGEFMGRATSNQGGAAD